MGYETAIKKWIYGEWGKSRLSIDELALEVYKQIYPDLWIEELEELSEKNLYKFKNYINLFNKTYKKERIICSIPLFIETIIDSEQYLYRFDSKFYLERYKHKKSINLINKFYLIPEIIENISKLNDEQFEKLSRDLFHEEGYNCSINGTLNSGDGGLDVYGYKKKLEFAIDVSLTEDTQYAFIQCKKWSNTIPSDVTDSWLTKIRNFKKNKGRAWRGWPFKEDHKTIENTHFYFIHSSKLTASGYKSLIEAEAKILELEDLAMLIIKHFDSFFQNTQKNKPLDLSIT